MTRDDPNNVFTYASNSPRAIVMYAFYSLATFTINKWIQLKSRIFIPHYPLPLSHIRHYQLLLLITLNSQQKPQETSVCRVHCLTAIPATLPQFLFLSSMAVSVSVRNRHKAITKPMITATEAKAEKGTNSRLVYSTQNTSGTYLMWDNRHFLRRGVAKWESSKKVA